MTATSSTATAATKAARRSDRLAFLASLLLAACPQGGFNPTTELTTGSTTSEGNTGATEPTTGATLCGNGVVDPGELCDDGASNSDSPWSAQKSCLATCAGHTQFCGDGLVTAPNEVCDINATAEPCTADCLTVEEYCGNGVCGAEEDASTCPRDCEPVCGDGVVQPGEECDQGQASASCNADCTMPPVCGDGIVNPAAQEECDDGNIVATDGCVACKHAFCGDGVHRADLEECDDGNGIDEDSCSNTCRHPRLMFVTSASWDGPDVGGVASATAKCIGAAQNKLNVPSDHTWRSWLSGSSANSSPALTIGKENLAFNGAYIRTDGKLIAQGWAGLTSGSLMNSISRTESGNPSVSTVKVWTNTTQYGLMPGNNPSCSNWTSSLTNANVGDYNSTDVSWTAFGTQNCNFPAHIYCLEVSQHGDGVVQPGEECDDGNAVDTDSCLTIGLLAKCGDGFVQDGVEECDDGNASDIDACLANCTVAKCGDGKIQDGVEECDDSNFDDTDFCRNGCTKAKCGDGVVWPLREDCDDGNFENGDDCTDKCRIAFCGDGFVNMGKEECDDGNQFDGDGCSEVRKT